MLQHGGRELKPETVFYPKTNMAIIRRPFYLLLKSGVLAQSHMHEDYLSVRLPTIFVIPSFCVR